MSKHTPGPWKVFNGTDVFPDDGDKEATRYIADCDMASAAFISGEEARANARLIAAAPDLLETLKGMVGMYVELVESGDAGFWDAEKVTEVIAARSAIAKAEGRS